MVLDNGTITSRLKPQLWRSPGGGRAGWQSPREGRSKGKASIGDIIRFGEF